MPRQNQQKHPRRGTDNRQRRGSSNFTKRRELAVQAALERHHETVRKSKSRAAAFGSRNITDAAARRREIFLRYSQKPKTKKEKLIEKKYAGQFADVVVGAFIIRKWLRKRHRWRRMHQCLKTVWLLRNPPEAEAPELQVAPGWHTLRELKPVMRMCNDEQQISDITRKFWALATGNRPKRTKITKKEYFLTMLRLAKALLTDFDSKNVLKVVEEDWRKDASNKKYMTFLELRSGLRELAKLWVKDSKATLFLQQLFKATTKISGTTHSDTRRPKWRKMNEIACILKQNGEVDPTRLTAGLTTTWEEIEVHERIVVDHDKVQQHRAYSPLNLTHDEFHGRVILQRKHNTSWKMMKNMPLRLQHMVIPIRRFDSQGSTSSPRDSGSPVHKVSNVDALFASPRPAIMGQTSESEGVTLPLTSRSGTSTPTGTWKHVAIVREDINLPSPETNSPRPEPKESKQFPHVPAIKQIKLNAPDKLFFQSQLFNFRKPNEGFEEDLAPRGTPLPATPLPATSLAVTQLPATSLAATQFPTTSLPVVYEHNQTSHPRESEEHKVQHYVTPSFQPNSTRIWQFGQNAVCSYDGYHRVLFVNDNNSNHGHMLVKELNGRQYLNKVTGDGSDGRPRTSPPQRSRFRSSNTGHNFHLTRKRQWKKMSHTRSRKHATAYRSGMLQTVQRINNYNNAILPWDAANKAGLSLITSAYRCDNKARSRPVTAPATIGEYDQDGVLPSL